MREAQIVVNCLSKTYRVPTRAPGFIAALKSLGQRTYQDVQAVREISFSIQKGEMVGFIGANGAGKTTTLKMLAGLLYPSSGEARVAGFTPWQRQAAFLRSISMVLGNKSQMIWDIPPLDTFRVLAEIYHLTPQDFQRTLDELVALLDMEDLLNKPVRNLSLGERMKCELTAGLLHRPQVLFLDEPTLGLDVSMQKRLRAFIAEYNRRSGATVILTSHYMADVAALCERILLIHQGQILYEGGLDELAGRLNPFKLVRITSEEMITENDVEILPPSVQILGRENGSITLRVHRSEAPSVMTMLLNHLPVTDLAVEDPPIEAVIDQIYQEGNL